MARTKYCNDYARIIDAQAASPPLEELPPFDLERGASNGFAAFILTWLLDNPRYLTPLAWLARRVCPVLRLPFITLVWRVKDARKVLSESDAYETPFGREMCEMAGGVNFILGMPPGDHYEARKELIMRAFPRKDVEAHIRKICRDRSVALLETGPDDFDVISGLMRRVPVQVLREYYGLLIDDDESFTDWSLALSTLFFGDLSGNPAVRDNARLASRQMLEVIDRSILAARSSPTTDKTVVERLVHGVKGMGARGAAPSDARNIRHAKELDAEELETGILRSTLMGMICGFVPTCLLAGGNAFDVVLRNRDADKAIHDAVKEEKRDDGDERALFRAVRETMRLKPINPGPWRRATRDTTLGDGGLVGFNRIRQGDIVWPLTLSVLSGKDALPNPARFDATRPDDQYLIYGHGMHSCLGDGIATVFLEEAFRALYKRRGSESESWNTNRLTGFERLKRRLWLTRPEQSEQPEQPERLGPFPRSLQVSFEPARENRPVDHSLVTICVPVAIKDTLENTGTVEQLRRQVDALGQKLSPAQSRGMSLQKRLDNTEALHFASMHVVASEVLTRADKGSAQAHLLIELSGDGTPDEVRRAFVNAVGLDLVDVLVTARTRLTWDDSLSVLKRYTVKVEPLAGKAPGLTFVGTPGHSVRRIRQEAALATAIHGKLDAPGCRQGPALQRLESIRNKMRGESGFDWALREAEDKLEGEAGGLAATRHYQFHKRSTLALLLVLLPVCSVFAGMLIVDVERLTFSLSGVAAFALAVVLGFTLLLTATLLVSGLVFWLIRQNEKKDRHDDTLTPPERFAALARSENRCAQNHMISVTRLKPGRFRRALLSFNFLLIGMIARSSFAPGRLSDIGSIHFARWVRLPGTDRLLFLSNYAGSWDSYLEDFITKASAGLTLAWSNSLGFPKTRRLFGEGAEDGDRFKRWARRSMQPTPFWYSAYPDLTPATIRGNAAIRRLFATASTEAEASEWLSRLGSAPGKIDGLEASNIQSLLFGPMGKLDKAKLTVLSIPTSGVVDRERLGEFLKHLKTSVTFGDRLPHSSAMICGFSAQGLETLGLPREPRLGVDALPCAFRQGMGNPDSAHTLGDVGDSAPEFWRWGSGDRVADVLLLHYADCKDVLDDMHRKTLDLARDAGLKQIAETTLFIDRKVETDAQGNSRKLAQEPFGFADGISQPRMSGVRGKFGTSESEGDDVVAKGEFILGYRDERKREPVPIAVSRGHDPQGLLPPVGGDSKTLRDFGRNGSFLVVRELAQFVDEFKRYCREQAEQVDSALGPPYEDEKGPERVAAKLMGRWQNGSSLVIHPHAPGDKSDNEFNFRVADPQGQCCPLGSHVRRANPRDGAPGEREVRLKLNNRHRLLRVGRTYRRPAEQDRLFGACPSDPGKHHETGTCFMAFNADIERQFEFVQQTWLNAATPRGDRLERDPMSGLQQGDACFNIPHEAGAEQLRDLTEFVRTRAGGYFFVPGRGALEFLASRTAFARLGQSGLARRLSGDRQGDKAQVCVVARPTDDRVEQPTPAEEEPTIA